MSDELDDMPMAISKKVFEEFLRQVWEEKGRPTILTPDLAARLERIRANLRRDEEECANNLRGRKEPVTSMIYDGPQLREALAAQQHEIWAHWMRYLFSVSVRRDDGVMLIPADKVERWERQMETDYADLTEQERESDRRQADKILAVLHSPVAAPEPDWSQAPEWAMWWAVDAPVWGSDMGSASWYADMPDRGDCKWLGPSDKEIYRGAQIEQYDRDVDLPIGVDWRTTLRKRPEVGDE